MVLTPSAFPSTDERSDPTFLVHTQKASRSRSRCGSACRGSAALCFCLHWPICLPKLLLIMPPSTYQSSSCLVLRCMLLNSRYAIWSLRVWFFVLFRTEILNLSCPFASPWTICPPNSFGLKSYLIILYTLFNCKETYCTMYTLCSAENRLVPAAFVYSQRCLWSKMSAPWFEISSWIQSTWQKMQSIWIGIKVQ